MAKAKDVKIVDDEEKHELSSDFLKLGYDPLR